MEFKGHIKVIADNGENERVLFDGCNTITELFEEIVAAGSISSLYCNDNAVEAGQSTINTKTFFNNNGPLMYDKDYLITVYLLNLSAAEKNALSSKNSMLPVFDGSFEIDKSKLVGYATATYTATSATQGHLTTISGINIINPRRYAKAWKWDAGTLSGEYNCIAIGSNILNNKLTGFKVNRGLDINNSILGESASSGYFLRTGVKTADNSVIYTTDEEIMLGNGEAPKKARLILNLLTGEVSKLATTDHRYDFPLAPAGSMQVVHNGHVIFNNYNNNGSMQYIDVATKTIKNITSGTTGCVIHDGYLYSCYGETQMFAFDLNSFSRVSSKDLNPKNLNIPKELLAISPGSTGGLSLTNYGINQYIISMGRNISNDTILSTPRYAVVCDDLLDVKNSIKAVVPQTTSPTCIRVGNKNYIFGENEFDSLAYNQAISLPTNSGAYLNVYKKGVKFSAEGMFGNLLSFKTFEEPQTISSSEGLTVEYYYTFEK